MSDPIPERRFSSLDLAGVQRLAADIVAACIASDAPSTVTLGLIGDLGAGKTTFAQAAVAALPGGAGLPVTSPTYAILQVYETQPPVRHVDLYRIGSVEELDVIGYLEMIELPGLNLVEWMHRIPEAVPSERLEIELVGPDDVRDISVRAYGARPMALLRKVPER